jgi:putative endonuclease
MSDVDMSAPHCPPGNQDPRVGAEVPLPTPVQSSPGGLGRGNGRAALGRHGEEIAVRWLERHGMVVVDRNWRCARGEIDIVVRDGDVLAFVEVKTRSGQGTGHPLEAVTAQKLGRLRRLVPAWFRAHPEHRAPSIRIDCVAVTVIGEHTGVEYVSGAA